MINDKISKCQPESTCPSIYFCYGHTIENQTFLDKILQVLGIPLNPSSIRESLKVYKASLGLNNLYNFIPITNSITIDKDLTTLTPYLSNQNNVICLLIDSNYTSFQSFFNKILTSISHKQRLYITYSNEIFSQWLSFPDKQLKFISYNSPIIFPRLLLDLFKDNIRDNYLSKKKIFKIEKVRRERNITFNAVIVNPVSEQNDDNEEEQDDHANSPNSLISISKEVFKFVKTKSNIKGNDVTSHIYGNLEKKGNRQPNFKNIQRRVYDAINVMSAIGVLHKTKEQILYVIDQNPNELTNFNNNGNGNFNVNGNNTFSNQRDYENNTTEEINPMKLGEGNSTNETSQLNIEQLKNSIKEKRQQLIKECSEQFFYDTYIKMNQSKEYRMSSCEKIKFPFYLIKLNSDPNHDKIKANDYQNKVVILSNEPIKMMSPEDFIKFFNRNDFTIDNLNEYYSKDIVKYIRDKKLIENYFNEDKDEMLMMFNNKERHNSIFYGQKQLYESNYMLDSDPNFNMYPGMTLRKQSEDTIFPTFQLEGNENIDKNYSNYLPSFYMKNSNQ